MTVTWLTGIVVAVVLPARRTLRAFHAWLSLRASAATKRIDYSAASAPNSRRKVCHSYSTRNKTSSFRLRPIREHVH
jgi:hypothetical protein